jgi:PleD family two-component response regulator
MNYKALLDEYKKLLRQLVLLIKISDLNQSELNSLSKRFEIASNIDVLTGLYNRRYFDEMYQKEWLSAIRSHSSLALIMIDIDFFTSPPGCR